MKHSSDYKPLINVIVIITAMLAVGISVVGYTYNTLVGKTISDIKEVCSLSAGNVAKKLAANIEKQEAFAVEISEDSIEDNISDKKNVIRILNNELMMTGSDMMRSCFVNKEGKGFAVRGNKTVNRIDISNDDYFKHAVNGSGIISDTVVDRFTGENVNLYAIPVRKNQKVIGVHVGIYPAEGVESAISAKYFGGEGVAYIINDDIERVVDSSYTESDEYDPFEKIDIDTGAKITMRRSIQGRPDGDVFVIKNRKGDAYFITYSPLGINNWYLMIAVPRAHVLRSANSVLIISLVMLVAVLIGTVAFMRYLNLINDRNREEVNRHIYFDELTGLYSANGFYLKTPEVLAEDNLRHAVLFMDIDNFRSINELFGYDEGTNILKHIGRIISSGLRDNEIAARTSGDNFVMLVGYRSDDDIKKRVNGYINAIDECSFDEDNTNYNVVVNFGIYKLGRVPHASEIKSYVDRARLSVSGLHNARKSSYAFFDEALQDQIRLDAELEKDVEDAIKNRDFKVYVQPKYDAKTRRLAGGEALIRWQHKTKGFLPPYKFVPLFEKTGVITDIDMFVYEEVCRRQSMLLREGYKPLPISVNQSRLHFYHSDYIDRIKSVLDRYSLSAEYIELEITENIALNAGDILEAAIKEMHKIGFKVSMDDFGSGESSLNVLKDIDIDVLKLDRLFFLETENNEKAKQIIKSIIDMANKLKISTVAEGVENEGQLKFLRDAGCDLIQGYLFAKPMPYDEFEELYLEQAEKPKK